MPKVEDKVQLIGSAIAGQAEAERKAIIEKANKIRQDELRAYEESLVDSMFGQVQRRTRDIRQKAVQEKAQAGVKGRREILRRRDELAKSVFAGARAKLREYSDGQQYRQDMQKAVAALKNDWDGSACTLYLRQEDMALAPQLTAALPGCQVQADPAIRLGGFRLLNASAGLLLDETLDSRLEDQRPWFLQNCGLKVTD